MRLLRRPRPSFGAPLLGARADDASLGVLTLM
jgi:hypothetical protein